MDPIFSSSPHLRLANPIIFRREAEMTARTFLIVIKVGCENELKSFMSAEDTGKRYEHADFDVLRLCCEDLYEGGGESL